MIKNVPRDVVLETSDYDMFNLNYNNRPVRSNTTGYRNLVKSMEIDGFMTGNPIICKQVGDKLFIMAGHHRLRAAMELGIPVKYVVSDLKQKVYDYEKAGVGAWSLKDYLDHFAKRGFKSYVVLKEYCAHTGIAPGPARALFSNLTGSGAHKRTDFGLGLWEITNSSLPKLVGDLVMGLIAKGFTWANSTSFVGALARVLRIEYIDPEWLKFKLHTKQEFLDKQRSIDKYIELLDLVYNHGTPKAKRLPLAHLADSGSK